MNPNAMALALEDLAKAGSFEAYVTEWAALQTLVKALTEAERNARKHIVAAAFPNAKDPTFPEGAHSFTMADGRKLTFTNKINRKIDPSAIPMVRAEFEALNDRPERMIFDDLLKVEYSLVISEFRKLGGTAAETAVAKMITAKPADTPDLKVA